MSLECEIRALSLLAELAIARLCALSKSTLALRERNRAAPADRICDADVVISGEICVLKRVVALVALAHIITGGTSLCEFEISVQTAVSDLWKLNPFTEDATTYLEKELRPLLCELHTETHVLFGAAEEARRRCDTALELLRPLGSALASNPQTSVTRLTVGVAGASVTELFRKRQCQARRELRAELARFRGAAQRRFMPVPFR